MKTRIYDSFVIGIIVGALSFCVIQVILGYTYTSSVTKTPENVSKDWTDVGGNIDIEYYLEVSEDSIWIENVSSHRVYGGTYTQLDSLINLDNL
jgi:hypothetical protein